jgi:hypothetical protein
MATKEDIAQSIATYIRQSSSTVDIVKGVQTKLDNLVYSESKEPLTNEDKLDIIQKIELDLRAPRVGDLRFLCESDNSEAFIGLMKAIEAKYKK